VEGGTKNWLLNKGQTSTTVSSFLPIILCPQSKLHVAQKLSYLFYQITRLQRTDTESSVITAVIASNLAFIEDVSELNVVENPFT
jgi:hypothetical protein